MLGRMSLSLLRRLIGELWAKYLNRKSGEPKTKIGGFAFLILVLTNLVPAPADHFQYKSIGQISKVHLGRDKNHTCV